MTVASVNIGRATAAQVDGLFLPRLHGYRNPVLYLHSSSKTGAEVNGSDTFPSVRLVMREIAAAHYPVVSPTGGTLWGNATHASRIADARTYLNTLGPSGDLLVVGVSMGACVALSWAAANPSAVAGVVGLLPVVDIEQARINNVGLRSQIDAAWGVTYPALVPTAANPSQNTAALSAIPIQLWYATDDVLSTGASSFATATGAELHSLGAIGHTDAAVAAVDTEQVLAFLGEVAGGG